MHHDVPLSVSNLSAVVVSVWRIILIDFKILKSKSWRPKWEFNDKKEYFRYLEWQLLAAARMNPSINQSIRLYMYNTFNTDYNIKLSLSIKLLII